MTTDQRPTPGSHDRGTPSGSLETSSANLFEVMLAARDAEARGAGSGALQSFYRTLMSGTLLFPVPPDHGDEAKAALASAVNDDDEVEISVMLARDGRRRHSERLLRLHGGALRLVAGRKPRRCRLPARVAFDNLAAAGCPAVLDPAGPIPYRFETSEVEALAAGRIPGTDLPLVEPASADLAAGSAAGCRFARARAPARGRSWWDRGSSRPTSSRARRPTGRG